jgi:hypothetical protein
MKLLSVVSGVAMGKVDDCSKPHPKIMPHPEFF